MVTVRSDGRKCRGGAQVSDLMIVVGSGGVYGVGDRRKAGLGLEARMAS